MQYCGGGHADVKIGAGIGCSVVGTDSSFISFVAILSMIELPISKGEKIRIEEERVRTKSLNLVIRSLAIHSLKFARDDEFV